MSLYQIVTARTELEAIEGFRYKAGQMFTKDMKIVSVEAKQLATHAWELTATVRYFNPWTDPALAYVSHVPKR